MNTIARNLLGVLILLAMTAVTPLQPAPNAAPPEPIITLTLTNETLGVALDTISRQAGVRINLDPRWKNHPVSADLKGMPFEKALKRLLSSLNHTIVWQAEDAITIMVFGESERAAPGQAVSFAAPPQEVPEDLEPFDPDELDEAQTEVGNERGDEGTDAEASPNLQKMASENGE
jgi:hypothetical protein